MSIEETPGATPTIEEVKEAVTYTWVSWWGIYDVEESSAAIDRFVASIKAEALREAADDYASETGPDGYLPIMARNLLHHRANELEQP